MSSLLDLVTVLFESTINARNLQLLWSKYGKSTNNGSPTSISNAVGNVS